MQPILLAIDSMAAHCEACSPRCSNTMRTARSRTSGEYVGDFFFGVSIAPSSQELEPRRKPGRFTKRYLPLLELMQRLAVQGNVTDTEGKTAFPDVIAHRRGRPDNYLVMEFKKTSSRVDDEVNFGKLEAYERDPRLRYRFALSIELQVGAEPGVSRAVAEVARAQTARDLAEHACATLDSQLQDSHALRADLAQERDRLQGICDRQAEELKHFRNAAG